MKKRIKLKRLLSGMMAVITILSSVLPSGIVYAEDTKSQEYPLYEEVKDFLSTDEVVKAEDIQLDAGVSFDIEHDFTGLEIPDKEKVKVELHEAKNSSGENFSTDHADTYKSVYYVEPVSGNPAYQVQRNIVIKEVSVTEAEVTAVTTAAESAGEEQQESGDADEESESQIQETVVDTVSETDTEASVSGEAESITEQPQTSTESNGEEMLPEVSVEETEVSSETTAEETEPDQTLSGETELGSEEVIIEETTEVSSETVIEQEELTETELSSESETETEEDTEKTEYQVIVPQSGFYKCLFDQENRIYNAGEVACFTIVLQDGIQMSNLAVIEHTDTADDEEAENEVREIELYYDAENEVFSFVMPENDVELVIELGQNAVMLIEGTEDEDPVPDKFKLINTGNIAVVPDSYQNSSLPDGAATQIRKVVFTDEDGTKVTRWAFCMQPNLDCPPGGTYDMDSKQVEILETGSKEKNLAKCLYYMYGGPAWGKTIDYTDGSGSVNMKTLLQNNGCSTTEHFFAVTHYMLGYIYVGANGNWNANSGLTNVMNSYGQEKIAKFVSYIKKLPVPKSELTATSITSTAGNGVNVSETVTYKAIDENVATIKLPDGVTLVNETTGTRSTGTVKIDGGTKFHLEADSSIVGTISYTLTCKYAVDFTAIALKTSGKQDVGFSYYSGDKILTLTVDWPEVAEIAIVKKDASTGTVLSGAVYGVYSDAACTDLIVQMPATDANGTSSVEITKTQDVVYLKEITAPSGYVVDTTVHNVKLVAGSSVSAFMGDKEQKASLSIYKEGEVLTGATVTENGTSFIYEKQRQKGAEYSVYAGADIVSADGTVIYKNGALIKSGLVTGEDGSVTLGDLYLGTYTVKETKAPTNLICTGETKNITLSYAGQNVEVVTGSVYFSNERQKAQVSVVKQDDTTKNPLQGGIYGLYAGNDILNVSGKVVVQKGTLIEKVTTDTNGNAVYSADLPIGNNYYIQELQAPDQYYRNSEDIYSFTFQYTNDKEAKVSFTHTFQNQRVDATVYLTKVDKETGETAQGDATLKGAVYGLYAREDIVHPDGVSGVLYKAGEQVATLTTDENGKAKIVDLYLGKYYVKELTAPVGYLLDEKEYDVACGYEGDTKLTVERSVEFVEQVIKQPFQIIKASQNGKTDADLLKGAGFSAYLVSSLQTNADGSYNFSSAEPVVLTTDGKTEMFTDEKGYACSIPLPYGVYVVRETTTPHNYQPVDNFIVTIEEHNPEKPQVWRVLLDEEFKAKLKIIKKDDETKQSVLIAGTEFKIYDLDAEKYVEQVTTYPVTTTHKSYFTDSQGYLILPNTLSVGNYRIEEVTAPDGYTLNTDYVEISVDANTAYKVDAVSGDVIIEVNYENHPVKGELTIYKEGEVLSGFGKDFEYETENLAGAVFEVRAAEDIYTADFQKDAEGNRILEYVEGTLIATVMTDEEGKAVLENLPLGKYVITEKTAPEGYVWNSESQTVEFEYAGQEEAIIKKEVTFGNERQKVAISVEKQDAENGSVVAGAVFGLYNETDIVSGEKVLVEAGTLLEQAETGEDGQAHFSMDLPFGAYYAKELEAPDGYVSTEEVLTFEAAYQGQDIPVVELSAVMKNDPTTVEITKSDITTSVELDGATLTVTDQDGNVVDTWTSVKDKPHVIKRLVVGETYTLKEEFAPYGYLRAEEVEFIVSDTVEIQKVEMKDAVPTGRIIISKSGEFVGEVTWNDMVSGAVESALGYISGSLQGVAFEVYALEDIKAADGVSEDYYKKDELVATMTTDALGFARADDLPLGKYYVVEKETVDGFVLDGEAREIDLTYRDQDTPVVTYDEDWQNNRQRATVTVWKKEKGTDRMLEGAVFALYTKEDIVNADGEVILEADTVIEQKATDQDGKITFLADLPVGGSFYVKEVQAPDGFVTTGEMQEFDFEYAGADTAEVTFEFTFENEATVFEITKSDLVNGGEIPGAKLQVTDEAGNVVDEWISETTPHVIKELVVGKSYTLTERIPANGYVTAESITFTVENTTEIQKVDMKDGVTKVQISKTDMTDGCPEVEGAKLYILDEEDRVMDSWISGTEPHYIEKLPIGKYTLLEESAPYGYIISERVPFEVKDIGEIQTVQMVDDTAMGKIILNKTDKATGEPMKGVEFELCNSKGKVLETLVTDSAGHAESELYPIATFKNGKFEKAIVYILKETKTLDGYVLDKTEHEVKFEYVDDKTPVVEYTLNLTNEESPEPGEPGTTTFTDAPKTGDETNIAIFLIALLLSAGCFVSLMLVRKRNK